MAWSTKRGCSTGCACGTSRSCGAPSTAPGAPTDVTLRPASELRYVGKDVPLTDLTDIVTGQAAYGMDVRRPGQLYAMIERSPVLGGTL